MSLALVRMIVSSKKPSLVPNTLLGMLYVEFSFQSTTSGQRETDCPFIIFIFSSRTRGTAIF